MKRDMELIKQLLLSYEEETTFIASAHDEDKVYHHVKILRDAGFIITDSYPPKNGGAYTYKDRLTWDGHEFISLIKQNEIWEVIKSEFKEATVETMLTVGKQIATEWAKNKVQHLLGKNS
ncbi:MAG: DUF2513 domain-containing protein [Candidatus Thiodiazotropha sp. (ex Monitilora ramsayi)]|nr:DUF2513 domain-containing protein [Candidatus Thiodiazotropha sp. (ex Monitilora ramsayi)]